MSDDGLFVIRNSPTLVEAWSVKRLPFEPKDWLVDFRGALRGDLANLDRVSGDHLHVTYSSADMAKCDVENACLYNVGLSAFRGLGAKSVVVERTYDVPPVLPSDLAGPPAHHYRYELADDGLYRWTCERVVASWADVELPTSLSPSAVWWAIRGAGQVEVLQQSDVVPLGVTVRIGSPRRSLIQMMKGRARRGDRRLPHPPR